MPHSAKHPSTCQDHERFSLAKHIEETRGAKIPKFNKSKHLNIGPIYDKFLDWYELYMKGKEFAEESFLLDDDGSLQAHLETVEGDVRLFLQSKNPRIVRVAQAWLATLQDLKWMIMVHDGALDLKQAPPTTYYENVDEFVASLES